MTMSKKTPQQEASDRFTEATGMTPVERAAHMAKWAPVYRGEQIRLLVETQVSALHANGARTLDRFDKVLLATAAAEVLYPAVAVDMPSWPVAPPEGRQS